MSPHQEATGWCEACRRQVLIRRKGISLLRHLILTILTAGVWVVVWFLLLPVLLSWLVGDGGSRGSVTRPWRCTNCGMEVSRSKGL